MELYDLHVVPLSEPSLQLDEGLRANGFVEKQVVERDVRYSIYSLKVRSSQRAMDCYLHTREFLRSVSDRGVLLEWERVVRDGKFVTGELSELNNEEMAALRALVQLDRAYSRTKSLDLHVSLPACQAEPSLLRNLNSIEMPYIRLKNMQSGSQERIVFGVQCAGKGSGRAIREILSLLPRFLWALKPPPSDAAFKIEALIRLDLDEWHPGIRVVAPCGADERRV